MKSLAKIFLYLFVSLLLGALIAPWVYWLLHYFPSDGVGCFSSLLASVQQMPLHRYVSRSIQVIALLLLWPVISSLHIQRFSELSLTKNFHAFSDLVVGVIVGMLPLCLLQLLFLSERWYVFKSDYSFVSVLRILGTAVVVALFEEFFFRGVLLGLCRRFFSNGLSIVVTAVLFAGVHFLKVPHSGSGVVHWWSGLALCVQGGSELPAWPLFLGAFTSLFVIGVILAWVTIRTRSLWLAFGLHAAWVFGQQFFNLLTNSGVQSLDALLPWLGTSQVYGMVPVGLLPLLPLGVTAILLRCWLRRRKVVLS